MSYDTNRNWMYSLSGRHIHLWQWTETGATDSLTGTGGTYKFRLPSEYYGKQLIYPNEDITSGLRVEYTAFSEPFVSEALEDTSARASGITMSFNDDGDSASTYNDLYDIGDGFGDFESGDKIRVIGSASNDGDYTLTSVSGSPRYIQVGTGNFTDEARGESITVYQIPKAVADASVDESSHINLNRMLSLAAVDYIRAQMKEATGDLQGKEYCMREFWKKVGDNESNKRNISISFPASPFAIK
jgi:hypothetical protein